MKIATNNLLTNKLDTSIFSNTLVHDTTTAATFIVEFGSYNFFLKCIILILSYVYGSLTGATVMLNQRGLGDVEINNSSNSIKS